jgi:hypothetical protein
VHGLPPSKVPNSLGDVMMCMANVTIPATTSPSKVKMLNTMQERPGSRRLSARDFFSSGHLDVHLDDISVSENWELVLSSGVRPDIDSSDVLFVGHADG